MGILEVAFSCKYLTQFKTIRVSTRYRCFYLSLDARLILLKMGMKMFKNGYDLIFLDLLMPRTNGTEVVKNIRLYEKKYEGNKNVIIAISSFATSLLGAQKNIGFDDHYCKPFMQNDLVSVVRKWVPHLINKNIQ